nr:TonB-dependent receptor [Niabella ginsengisoli]
MPINEITSLYEDHYKSAQGYYLSDSLRKYVNGSVRDNIILPLLWGQRENRFNNRAEQLNASVRVNYQIAKPVSLNIITGTTRNNEVTETKQKWMQYSDPTSSSDLQGQYRVSQGNSYRNYLQGFLNFNHGLGEDFKLSLSGGATIDNQYGNVTTQSTNGLKFRDVFSLSNNKGTPNAPSGSQGGEALYAVVGTGELSFKNYLYLNATARNDWSSKLPDYSRSYFYPSVGLSFVASEAFQLPKAITYLKFRASQAVVGNSVPSRYFASAGFSYGTYQLPNGSTIINSSIPTSIPPVSVIAEKNYSTEFGTEASFFRSRIHADLTFYFNKGKDLLNSVNVAQSSAAQNFRINSGSVSNRGFEFQLDGDIISNQNIVWNMGVNGTTIKRKVLTLAAGLEERLLGNPFGAAFKAVPGSEPYTIWMRKIAKDENNNIIVSANGLPKFNSELSFIANGLPKFYGGISNQLSYRGISLYALLDYSYGGHMVSYTNNYLLSSGVGKESLFGRNTEYGGLTYYNDGTKNILLETGQTAPSGFITRTDGIIVDGVKENGSANDVILSAASYYSNRYGGTSSEESVYKNNFIRLGEIALTYTLPENIVSRIGIQGLSVSFIGRNLAFLHKTLPNIAPSNSMGTNSINSAFEYTVNPSSRNFGVSIKANL